MISKNFVNKINNLLALFKSFNLWILLFINIILIIFNSFFYFFQIYF